MARELNLIVPSRRGFLRGLGAAAGLALAAPAIVKAESLMRVRGLVLEPRIISRLDVLYGYTYVRPEWAFSLDEYSEKILVPMAKQFSEKIAAIVMNGGSPYGLSGLLGHLPADYVTRISNVD